MSEMGGYGGQGGGEARGSGGEISSSGNEATQSGRAETGGRYEGQGEQSASELSGLRIVSPSAERAADKGREGESSLENLSLSEPAVAEADECGTEEFSALKGFSLQKAADEVKAEGVAAPPELDPHQELGEKRSVSEERLETARKSLRETIERNYDGDPEMQQRMLALSEEMQEATRTLYEDSREVALRARDIENFSDHNMAHIPEVAEAALNNAKAIHEFEESNHIPKEARIRDDILLEASMWHDVGMAGTQADIEAAKSDPEAVLDGGRIRAEHSARSAQAVLENQEKFSCQEEAVEVAWLAYLHSKSNSGVKTMSSEVDMTASLNRMKAVYEAEHPGGKKLDLTSFGEVDEQGGLTKIGDAVRARINNESVALRVADAQRPASDEATTMTGRLIRPDVKHYEDVSGFDMPLEAEVFDKNVEYIDPEDPENRSAGTERNEIMYASGEKNVDAGEMRFVTDARSGDPKVEIHYAVKDAYVDQAATREVLVGRMKEANSTAAREHAVDGSIVREEIEHVVELEKGDEAARAKLESVLQKALDRQHLLCKYLDEDGGAREEMESMTARVRVILKESTATEAGGEKND